MRRVPFQVFVFFVLHFFLWMENLIHFGPVVVVLLLLSVLLLSKQGFWLGAIAMIFWNLSGLAVMEAVAFRDVVFQTLMQSIFCLVNVLRWDHTSKLLCLTVWTFCVSFLLYWTWLSLLLMAVNLLGSGTWSTHRRRLVLFCLCNSLGKDTFGPGLIWAGVWFGLCTRIV